MNKKLLLVLIVGIAFISLFFNVYKKSSSPVCLNADEAAFGYNAYSLLKTGRDEYGTTLPLRLKSFGDYKMPLYSYLSIPFIKIFSLNENSTRALNDLLALLLPVTIFFLTKELFEKNSVALLTAFLIAVSLGLHLIGRQAHESYLAVFLLTLSSLFFIKTLKKTTFLNTVVFCLLILLSLFSYQSSRIFAVFFLVFAILYAFQIWHTPVKKSLLKFIGIFLIVIAIFGVTDLIYKPSRVTNLLFFNNIGFTLKINELRSEGGPRLLYNKLTVGTKEVVSQYLAYFSPEFLVTQGDTNPRFGFPGMSPVTPLEYLFIGIGFYYLFKNNARWKYFLLGLLLVSPLPAASTWNGTSLTRSLFIIIPILIIGSYGGINLIISLKTMPTAKKALIYCLVLIELFFLFYSWDFYLNHYPKRALVIRSWQCGYKELADYIGGNYGGFNKFYITKKNGEPYIFLLFYLKNPPTQYQKQARLTAPDEFGFGQVEQFDKFNFNFSFDPKRKRVVYIGYPDDFTGIKIDSSKIKKIKVGTEEIFWIYKVI